MQIVINLLQSRESRQDDEEDVLPAPVSSLEELDDLCTEVANETYKIKLVRISCMILDMMFLDILDTIYRCKNILSGVTIF